MLTRFSQILLIISLSFFAYLLLFQQEVNAQLSFDHPNYEVTIDINEDSTFNVTEKVTIVFDGPLNGYRRDIPLYNSSRSSYCAESGNATCGGFDMLVFQDFQILEGEKHSNEDFKTYIVTAEDGSRDYRIEQRLYDSETNVSDDRYTFEFSYKIFGGIQWLENSQGQRVPFFYWNMLPGDTVSELDSAKFRINFPDSVDFIDENLVLYSSDRYVYRYNEDNNQVEILGDDLGFFDFATLSYEFQKGEILEPASVHLAVSPAIFTQTYIDGLKIDEGFGNTLNFIPVGEHEFSFERFGYESKTQIVDLQAGDRVNLEVNLTPKVWMYALIGLIWILNVLGVVGLAFAIWKIWQNYKNKGRDEQMPKTIVPEYAPPKGVHPYLLGSLKDETVDQSDITGTLIDLAYRGFIKIKEIKKGKEYELTRMGGKSGEKLTAIEAKIMKALFKTDTDFVNQFKGIFGEGNENMNFVDLFDFSKWGQQDNETVSEEKVKNNEKSIGKTIKTKNLGVSFVNELEKIKNDIYDEMVERDYFKKSPKTVRSTYLGIGITSLVFGLVATIGLSIGATLLVGIIIPFLLFIGGIAAGLIYLFLHGHMPAKTANGSAVYAKILGFKMYMETAERFRVQDLTPETFEKYLSYAIVFGIEKKWAKQFEDIYKDRSPDWYEGRGGLFDVWVLSNLSRSFVNTTNSTVTKVSRSSGASGGGWSGGGSFGGFSGGGGGGGSSGGW